MATEDDKTEDQTTEDQTEAEEEEGESPDLGDETSEAGEFDDEDLALLTDEERAALTEGDEDEAADEADQDDEPPAAQQPDPVQQQAEPEPERPAKAEIDPEVTAKVLADAKAAKKALFAQYEDGELTRDQYLEGLEKIDTESSAAAAAAALEAKQQEQAYEEWKNEATAYLKAVPELTNPAHLEAFDAHVRRVTNDPRSANLTYRQMLEKAHRYYLADQPDVSITIPPLPGAQKAPAKPAAQKAEPPITLAKMPASVPSAVSDGRYGQLQKAIDDAETAEEVERIMAGMSEAEREAFASMDA